MAVTKQKTEPQVTSVRGTFTFKGKEYPLADPPPRKVPNQQEEVGRLRERGYLE